MPLDSYTNLKAAAVDWLKRGDITAASTVLTDGVSLVEADMNSALRIRDMEASTALTATSAVTALPADFLELRSAPRISTDPTRPLEIKTIEQIEQMGGTTGVPRFYALRGTDLVLGPPPDASRTLTIFYWRRIPDLATNSVNTILTRWPTAYFHGLLARLFDYTRNAGESDKYRTLFAVDMEMIQKQDRLARFSGAAPAVRVS